MDDDSGQGRIGDRRDGPMGRQTPVGRLRRFWAMISESCHWAAIWLAGVALFLTCLVAIFLSTYLVVDYRDEGRLFIWGTVMLAGMVASGAALFWAIVRRRPITSWCAAVLYFVADLGPAALLWVPAFGIALTFLAVIFQAVNWRGSRAEARP